MALYKVIQDIEAEDKFVGPLTLKQFIFAGIFAVCLYLSFIFITKNAPFLIIFLLPVMLVTGFLAFPWGRDQPTEVWLMAKIRFFVKPRKRIWDQTGIQELVTITAPKQTNFQYTDNLSPYEVKSRLRALADTIDSRGWAAKSENVSIAAPGFVPAGSDRLVGVANLPVEVPNIEVYASDDMMDVQNNPLAQQLTKMINDSSESRRQTALQNMEDVRSGVAQTPPETSFGTPPPNYWFVNTPDPSGMPADFTGSAAAGMAHGSADQLSEEEKAVLDKLHEKQSWPSESNQAHLKVILPLDEQAVLARAEDSKVESQEDDKVRGERLEVRDTVSTPTTSYKPSAISSAVPTAPDPAILQLAQNNDRDVASLAREAHATMKNRQPEEIMIKLH